MNKKIRQNILPLLGSLLGIFLLWEVAAILLGRYFLPQPTEVAFTTGRLFADGKILAHILASLRRITFGTAAGLGAALPVGILMGRIPAADRILGAFFRFLYPVPKVVFMPIVVVMLGIGDAAKIFLIFLAVFFQMTIIIRDSAASLEQELTDVMRSMNADRAAVLRHLVLPGILPGILTALKASLGTSVALLMITELFASTSGLGYFIMNSMDSRDYPQMYAGIVILALMSAVLYGVLEAAESILCRLISSLIPNVNPDAPLLLLTARKLLLYTPPLILDGSLPLKKHTMTLLHISFCKIDFAFPEPVIDRVPKAVICRR